MLSCLSPIKIGHIDIDPPLFLAPMAGITDYPFRKLAREFGVGAVVSEMLASQALIRDNQRTIRMVSTAREEYPLVMQISGVDPDTMAESARICRSLGAAIVDINMGCPQPKIVKTGAGAALMKDESLAGRIIESVVKAVDIPVTVKIRLGWDVKNMNGARIAKIAQEAGASLITVHGRTRSQMFAGRADWQAIGVIREEVSIPVVANGDITCPDDIEKCLKASGADGVMIGRGALGRPWLFLQCSSFMKHGKAVPEPGLEEQYKVARRHLEYLMEFYGHPTGVWLARKHMSWYTKGLKKGALFRKAVNMAETAEEIKRLLDEFYTNLLENTC